jgi:hypothetical protein
MRSPRRNGIESHRFPIPNLEDRLVSQMTVDALHCDASVANWQAPKMIDCFWRLIVDLVCKL